MTKLSSKVLDRIKKEKVTPKPKWYFILMHSLLLLTVTISIVLGSIAVAIVIRHLTSADWELIHIAIGGKVRSFIILLPYIWLLFIGIVLLIADRLFKHTRKGHRIPAWKVALGSVMISVCFGLIIFAIRADRPVEKGLRDYVKPYAEWQEYRQKVFNAPERGILIGRIAEIHPKAEWMVIDFMHQEWLVDISSASLYREFKPYVGLPIGIKGKKVDNFHFRASQIAPWRTVKMKIKEKTGISQVN
jgi:hypothetical protein